MKYEQHAKVIAFYFPQFHSIPENDLWWGKGFTDWDNVKRARPLFKGHNQPRIPLSGNYYDQSDPETIVWQAELAKSRGVYGFCHHHYWFDGVQLLEAPTNIMMSSKEIDFPFCLSWANETWSKRWDGRDHYILQAQTHEPSKEKWEQHFQYLIKAWTDERAIRIDGKPVFLIYRPHRIPELDCMFDYWRSRAVQYGLDDLYFIAIKQYDYADPGCLKHFDAIVHFQPFEAMLRSHGKEYHPSAFKTMASRIYNRLPGRLESIAFKLHSRFASPRIYDYDDIWRKILDYDSRDYGMTTYPGAFIDWDNTPRYGRRAQLFRGSSPERFGYWMDKLIASVTALNDRDALIFVNAWNEWAEGTYLEPDAKHGLAYLDALQRCVYQSSVAQEENAVAV